ncbi:MAG TPA: hypothetical protein VI583_15140 [Cyclobacteriaceae bacterium]|nr:hypothetical protein [Cyclobacteriaceae bacterium]
MKLRHIIICILSTIIIYPSCNDSLPHDDIPRVLVSEELNLNDYRYLALKQAGGFIYIDGGVRGIIVYRNYQDQFLAFERNCPYQPGNSCALVSVDKSNQYLTDSCCFSNFDFDGLPIAGPAEFPLLQYITTVSQDILYISSD